MFALIFEMEIVYTLDWQLKPDLCPRTGTPKFFPTLFKSNMLSIFQIRLGRACVQLPEVCGPYWSGALGVCGRAAAGWRATVPGATSHWTSDWQNLLLAPTGQYRGSWNCSADSQGMFAIQSILLKYYGTGYNLISVKIDNYFIQVQFYLSLKLGLPCHKSESRWAS